MFEEKIRGLPNAYVLLPKDTKSLGNNKAPACESRGFVLKKEGVLFDTPSLVDQPGLEPGTSRL